MLRLTSIILAAFVLMAAPVRAHLGLMDPQSRYGPNVLKDGPCGMGNGPRTANVTVYEPGATIEVVWEEYRNHPGHYRIAFDADGQDDFVDPAEIDELYSNDAVLMDGIDDKDGGIYRVSVELPDIECESCTLQVVQVMTDKLPYTVGGNDLYYQCADLVLRAGGAPDAGIPGSDAGTMGSPDAGTPGGDAGAPGSDGGTTGANVGSDPGGCATIATRDASDGTWAALLTLAIVLRRRRVRVRAGATSA